MKDIKENEELTFDYQFDFFKTPFTKCYCGVAKCKGYLGVLATTNQSDQTSLSKQISALECGYCKKMILDNSSLLMCKGANKETYHVACVMKRETGKQTLQRQALSLKTFICKQCKLAERKKVAQEAETGSDHGDNENADMEHQAQVDSAAAANLIAYPWDSTNPNVRRYYDES